MSDTITIEQMREDCDWQSAFEVAGASDALQAPCEVLYAIEGVNDGDNWIAVLKLPDGRFGFLTAWCDYTGWGCRDGGDFTIADTLGGLLRGVLGDEDRERLGIVLDDSVGSG